MHQSILFIRIWITKATFALCVPLVEPSLVQCSFRNCIYSHFFVYYSFIDWTKLLLLLLVFLFCAMLLCANRIASGTEGNWMKSMENLWAKVRSFRLSAMSQLKILIDKMRFRWFFSSTSLETHKSKCRSFFIATFLMAKIFESGVEMLCRIKKTKKCVR